MYHVSCIRGKRLTRLVKWAVKIVQILKIAIEFSSDIYIDAFDILNQRMKNRQFFGLLQTNNCRVFFVVGVRQLSNIRTRHCSPNVKINEFSTVAKFHIKICVDEFPFVLLLLLLMLMLNFVLFSSVLLRFISGEFHINEKEAGARRQLTKMI